MQWPIFLFIDNVQFMEWWSGQTFTLVLILEGRNWKCKAIDLKIWAAGLVWLVLAVYPRVALVGQGDAVSWEWGKILWPMSCNKMFSHKNVWSNSCWLILQSCILHWIKKFYMNSHVVVMLSIMTLWHNTECKHGQFVIIILIPVISLV